MATCEKCGASFDRSAAPVEVTTTRILCAPCLAERAAEKARQRALRQGAPAAAPVPAKQPPARPMAAAPVRAAPTPPPAARTASPASAPKAPAAPAAKAAPAKPKAKPARVVEIDKESRVKSKNRAVVIGYVVTLVLAGVAAVVVWRVMSTKRERQELIEAAEKRVSDFHTAFMAMDISNEENALAAAKFAEDNRAIWEKNSKIGVEVQSRFARASTNAKLFKERRELDAQIAQIETDFGAPATLSPDRVVEARRLLEDIEPKVTSAPELLMRVSALRSSADQLYAERLLEDARSSAAAGATRETLQRFARAEDELRALIERAMKDKNSEKEQLFKQLFQQAVSESDKAVEAVFTPEEIEKAPWRDLLADRERENWLAPGAKGFEWRLENGELHVIGPDSDAEGIPILSIGDREKWRDFVGEMEFTIVKGEAALFFRLPLTSNARETAIAPQLLSTVAANNALVAGEKYKATFSVVASKFRFELQGQVDEFDIHISRIRKGALAFEIDPKHKTELRISNLRAKVLRAGE